MNKYKILRIKQLDERLNSPILLRDINVPKTGWIHTVRSALYLTYKKLGERLNVSSQAVQNFERSENEGNITLNSLRKIAEGMNCCLVYAIVPNSSLEKILDKRIKQVAEKLVSNVSHSMKLEEQGISETKNQKEKEEIYNKLKDNLNSKIWNYEV